MFRFVSFLPFETFGPHKHLRIEINYVKKANCILHLENESISFKENEMMVICSNVEHTFEAGSEDTTLMQLEFLPEVFFRKAAFIGIEAVVPHDAEIAQWNVLQQPGEELPVMQRQFLFNRVPPVG